MVGKKVNVNKSLNATKKNKNVFRVFILKIVAKHIVSYVITL